MKKGRKPFLTTVFWPARRAKYKDVFCKSCRPDQIKKASFLRGFFNLAGCEEKGVYLPILFDIMFATSQSDTASTTPQPFDRDRDRLVIGEGACSLILEELEYAKARGATIYAEIVGFATNSDGMHITSPTAETMEVVMRKALSNANLESDAIGYVNAHGTATEQGDIAESNATETVFGSGMPISSLKSYFGHTLGACGALESWLSIEMINNHWFAGTANLNHIDERCGDLDYLTGAGCEMQHEYVMSNNFAFGGVNTSLVFRRW